MTVENNVRWPGLGDGARAVAPLLAGVVPFGLVVGVTAAGSVVGSVWGYASSVIIFAGAAQLATIQLLDTGAAVGVVILTGLVINVRHLMYSAALAPHFSEFPRASRFVLPYVMTDQVFAVSQVRFAEATDPVYRRWFYIGAGATLWSSWQFASIAGVLLGVEVPESWGLEFTIPLVFLVLLVPVVETRPGLIAAIVGGGVAVLAHGASLGLGLVLGAVAGVAAGVAADRMGR